MYSLRMKLNDVIGKDEQVILENIRRCKQFVGRGFLSYNYILLLGTWSLVLVTDISRDKK